MSRAVRCHANDVFTKMASFTKSSLLRENNLGFAIQDLFAKCDYNAPPEIKISGNGRRRHLWQTTARG